MSFLRDVDATVERACSAGEEFANIFYDTIDKKKHLISHLYTSLSSVVWNGHNATGVEAVTVFLQSLPSSTHTLTSLDCQPIPEVASPGQTSILVATEGTVKYEGNRERPFSQNFVLTEQSGVWKIVSDCFRFTDESE
ncbi:NTF2-related export protein 1-like [Oscarella lobularis]|uniref:NTF2-related export protein 1-like n=1 Tax=Oscarella lobularis TaxID=121494 RepID=UPI003313B219